MQEIKEGDTVFAISHDLHDYVLVAEFTVDRVGVNFDDDPDRTKHGKWFFESNRPQYFAPSSRTSVESTLRNSELAVKAEIFGQSFQGHNGVRRITSNTARLLLLTVTP